MTHSKLQTKPKTPEITLYTWWILYKSYSLELEEKVIIKCNNKSKSWRVHRLELKDM